MLDGYYFYRAYPIHKKYYPASFFKIFLAVRAREVVREATRAWEATRLPYNRVSSTDNRVPNSRSYRSDSTNSPSFSFLSIVFCL